MSPTSDESSKVRLDERGTASDGHERAEHHIGDLVGVEGGVTLVDLHQARHHHLDDARAGTRHAHHQGDAPHSTVVVLSCDMYKRGQ